eukprot:1010979-Pleurochrysis_carterae.AAC.1
MAPSEGVGETFGEPSVSLVCSVRALGHVGSVADSSAFEATADAQRGVPALHVSSIAKMDR